jgi:soluble lytic murein transglycosylase-like protein
VIVDTLRVDIWPLIDGAAKRWSVPAELLAALCQAESGLNPLAWREGTPPDVSGGLTQISVALAHEYGIGTGEFDWANKRFVQNALSNRAVALDLGARYLADCLDAAGGDWLMSLRRYNAGDWGATQAYADQYPANIATYKAALAWAHEVLA